MQLKYPFAIATLFTLGINPSSTWAQGVSSSSSGPSSDLSGIRGQSVTIRRDAYGVPSVVGVTDEAAMYGLGWASAEDRLFQMNVTALVAQGRTAEFFGNDAGQLNADKTARITGAWRNAKQAARSLSAADRRLLDAYAKGVNDYVARNADALHPRFAELEFTPQRWTAAHSIAAWRALTSAYSTSALSEAERLVQFEADVERYGLDIAVETWLDTDPGDPEAGVVQTSDLEDAYMDEVYHYAASMGYGDGRDLGWGYDGEDAPHFSHAYALGPDRTTTGEAILIADPQVPVLMPAFWYEFHVQSPSFSARGIGAPGTPGIAVGFNESVAWGITAGSGDQADLFRLDTDRARDGHYVVDGRQRPFHSVDEEILVADGASQTVTFRRSLWGPVVTDLLSSELEHEYALRNVSWADGGRSTLEGMFGMMRATDIGELQDALDDWRAPVVNLIAADSSGNIYYSLIGGIPVRSTNAHLGGMVAQDGSTTESQWQDIMPHSVLPQVTNPASGTVYSGNHRSAGDWYPLPLGTPVEAGGHSHRSRRIRDLLDNTRIFTPDEVVEDVQLDCVDPSREGVVRIGRQIEAVAPGSLSRPARAALTALDEWYEDGATMLTDQPSVLLASSIAVNFRVNTTGSILQDIYGGGAPGMSLFLDDMYGQLEEDPRMVPEDTVIAFIDTVLTDAMESMPTDRGTWSAVYEAERAVQEITYFDMFNKLSAGNGDIHVTEPLPCAHGNSVWAQPSQSYSQVVDFAGMPMSVMPPGNSEHRTGHITDQVDLWVDGEFKPAPVDNDGLSSTTVSIQRLIYRR